MLKFAPAKTHPHEEDGRQMIQTLHFEAVHFGDIHNPRYRISRRGVAADPFAKEFPSDQAEKAIVAMEFSFQLGVRSVVEAVAAATGDKNLVAFEPDLTYNLFRPEKHNTPPALSPKTHTE